MIKTRPILSVDVNRQESKPTVTNNITITNAEGNATTSTTSTSNLPEYVPPPVVPNVIYPSDEYNSLATELIQLRQENQALRLILEINKSNPLIINDYIIPSEANLTELIKTLTAADDVQINAEDVECGCSGSSKYRRVSTIYVIKNNESVNFKYSYGSANKLLNDEHISTKYVF